MYHVLEMQNEELLRNRTFQQVERKHERFGCYHVLLREDENFRGFLFIVTRNLIFNRQKKTFNENFYKLSVLSAYEQSNIDSYNIEEELQAKELNNYIDKIIEELPPKQQEIFILSRKENLSHKEIAELLNISERTVEVHIARAIRHIKSRLEYLIALLGVMDLLN